jgi:hypothetical protein
LEIAATERGIAIHEQLLAMLKTGLALCGETHRTAAGPIKSGHEMTLDGFS